VNPEEAREEPAAGTAESLVPGSVRELGTPAFAKKHVKALAASLVLTFVFAWVMKRGSLPMLPPAGALSRVGRLHYACFVLLMLAHLLLRFARCYFLTEPIAHVPARRLMTINAIAMVLITLLPLRLGEMARPAMLRTQGHLSAWAVTGTVFAERIIDGLVYAAALLLGLLLAVPHEPLPSSVGGLPVPASLVPQAGKLASLGFGAAFVVMVVFYRYRSFARRATERIIGVVSTPLGQRVADIVGRLSDGLNFLTDPRYTLPYIVVTLGSAFAHIWALQLLGHAVGLPELTLAQATLMTGVLSLAFILPNAPGFFGAIQLALYAGLAVYVAPEKVIAEGAVLVFLFYVSYLGLIVALGAGALGLEYFARAPTEEPQARG
jgi:hypothetical protein